MIIQYSQLTSSFRSTLLSLILLSPTRPCYDLLPRLCGSSPFSGGTTQPPCLPRNGFMRRHISLSSPSFGSRSMIPNLQLQTFQSQHLSSASKPRRHRKTRCLLRHCRRLPSQSISFDASCSSSRFNEWDQGRKRQVRPRFLVLRLGHCCLYDCTKL